MSWFATEAVWELDLPAAPGVSKSAAKLVALNLAMRVGDDGRNAWPKVGTIARDTSLGERTVQRVLRHLQRLGVVVTELPSTPRLPTSYALGPWYPAWMERHGWGDKVTPQRRHRGTPRGAKVAPEPLSEPVSEVGASQVHDEPESTAELAERRRLSAGRAKELRERLAEGSGT